MTRSAFVTGASRGIGAACAIALARAGFDVAISARTVETGEEREHSPTLRRSDTTPLPGSLTETSAAVEAAGRAALVVPADLLDRASLERAAAATLEAFGRIDVVVHNGRYVGAGHMDRILDTPVELVERQLYANTIGALVLTKAFLPTMLEQRSGTIVTITSAVAYADPLAPAGGGGWGLGYGASKAALHRVAGVLNAEHADDGIRAFNVQPGMIDTERTLMESGAYGFGGWGAPAEVVGAVVAWVATDARADRYRDETIEAQFLCHELGLLPSWPGPVPNRAKLRYDRSGERLRLLEQALVKEGHDDPR
ncbi:MAG TPA: SDR family oxidoreductase [Acidimicrobiales bacterium]|nr:SDR family oxidoreductase [Acidimicrobiales bacterium]